MELNTDELYEILFMRYVQSERPVGVFIFLTLPPASFAFDFSSCLPSTMAPLAGAVVGGAVREATGRGGGWKPDGPTAAHFGARGAPAVEMGGCSRAGY